MQSAPGSRAANRSSPASTALGLDFSSKSALHALRKLTHHGRRGQPMSDTVADDQRNPAGVEADDVIPVPADLQRPTGRVVPHGEAARQTRGTEHRMLQSHRGFALLIDLVNALQALAEASRQHRQQRVVF